MKNETQPSLEWLQEKMIQVLRFALTWPVGPQGGKWIVLCPGCMIMYTVYTIKSRSADHIYIWQSKNMEVKISFLCINSRIP
jgi:hypothetical protein